jgi:hypothetical protein
MMRCCLAIAIQLIESVLKRQRLAKGSASRSLNRLSYDIRCSTSNSLRTKEEIKHVVGIYHLNGFPGFMGEMPSWYMFKVQKEVGYPIVVSFHIR